MKEKQTYLYQPFMSTNIQILEKRTKIQLCVVAPQLLSPNPSYVDRTPKMEAASKSVFVLDLQTRFLFSEKTLNLYHAKYKTMQNS